MMRPCDRISISSQFGSVKPRREPAEQGGEPLWLAGQLFIAETPFLRKELPAPRRAQLRRAFGDPEKEWGTRVVFLRDKGP